MGGRPVEFLLRPGMRLMRRVGVAGKFGLIAVLLLVPMCTSMIASYREATGQISIADRERVGLRYTRPLVELVIELSQTRNLANQGEKPGDGWLRLVHELDDLTVESGETLSVSTAWPQLRAQTKAVYDDALTHSQRAVLADQVAKQTRRLLQQVADAAHLMVDPQLDSNYLITMLVDELPRVVTAAADAQAVRSTHRQGDDPVALRLAARRPVQRGTSPRPRSRHGAQRVVLGRLARRDGHRGPDVQCCRHAVLGGARGR
ncbi:MAG: hypothetical protein IPJ14_18060 [Kineosporiaceae bacterium]|nr:hypothetical protein [Kineosporiaceae bacterium]